MTDDDLLNEFEGHWNGGKNAVAQFAKKHPNVTPGLFVELMKVDIELRWRHDDPIEVTSPEYQVPLANTNSEQLAELVAWEFAVRNDWGDCISREELEARHTKISVQLRKEVDLVAKDVAWPVIRLREKGITQLSLKLDRRFSCGRRRSQAAPDLETDYLRQHVNLSDIWTLTLSREQLEIHRVSKHAIHIKNCSRNRAVAIESFGVLEAGQSTDLVIPVFIILGENLSITISEK